MLLNDRTITVNAINPPDDVLPFHRPGTTWLEFRRWVTPHIRSNARATVGIDSAMSPAAFILHWIEGDRAHPGHGTEILNAVDEYADRHALTGWLVCDLAEVPWYQRHGWVHIGPYLALHQMARTPR